MAIVRLGKGETGRSLVKLLSLLFFCALGWAPVAKGALQFDVFLGYDGIVPEASWFPVVCEIHNDGPSFNAFVEISSGQFNQSQVRRVPLELPTNTRKRVVVPVFSSSRYATWNIRLIDEKNKVRAEDLNKRPRKQTAWEIPMVGALARSVGGVPILPPIKPNQQEIQPVAARLQPALFPDNPIALEGLNTLYLNSETALELKVGQRDALLAWLNGGGHLVVSVEQIADLGASAWLQDLLPCELSSTAKVRPAAELQTWMRIGATLLPPGAVTTTNVTVRQSNRKNTQHDNAIGPNPFLELVSEEKFDQAEMLVFTGKQLDGAVLASVDGIPLMVQATRGRGKITLLAFSAEREPFVSWKNRSWFWAKLTEIPVGLYQSSDYNVYGGYSIDGVFGSMIDSKQIRKLPLAWLLLLLVVYLLVIGPLDQYWLKKINRQMLTWITFPTYVLIFSGLIYFIGFQLRAGDSELNELHVVDILPRNDKAILRGRTYASIYSPSNKRYALAGEQPVATLRSEFMSSYSGAEETGRATVIHRGNNFAADVSVPVWTSQLYVSDWLQPSDAPMRISLVRAGANWDVSVENKLDRSISEARVVVEGRVFSIGDLPARQTKKIRIETSKGVALKEFVRQNGSQFFQAVQSRRQTFGTAQRVFDVPLGAMAASFNSQLNDMNGNQFFVSPNGFDLSKLAVQGSVILLAWDAGHSLTKPLNKFTPRRSHADTLLRLVVPKEISASP